MSFCSSPSTCITSVCTSRLASSSRSPSLSELFVGLFCLLLWAGRSPGVDLGRGGGITVNLFVPIDFKAVVLESVLESLLPECRLRRAGTMIESIMILKLQFESFCWETSQMFRCKVCILVIFSLTQKKFCLPKVDTYFGRIFLTHLPDILCMGNSNFVQYMYLPTCLLPSRTFGYTYFKLNTCA